MSTCCVLRCTRASNVACTHSMYLPRTRISQVHVLRHHASTLSTRTANTLVSPIGTHCVLSLTKYRLRVRLYIFQVHAEYTSSTCPNLGSKYRSSTLYLRVHIEYNQVHAGEYNPHFVKKRHRFPVGVGMIKCVYQSRIERYTE